MLLQVWKSFILTYVNSFSKALIPCLHKKVVYIVIRRSDTIKSTPVISCWNSRTHNYLSGAPEFTPSLWWGSCCLVPFLCCVMCTIICLFVFFSILAMALSVHFDLWVWLSLWYLLSIFDIYMLNKLNDSWTHTFL